MLVGLGWVNTRVWAATAREMGRVLPFNWKFNVRKQKNGGNARFPVERFRNFINLFSILFSNSVAPICRPGQITTYNVGRGEMANIQCEVEANPTDVNFVWKFNTSISEMLDMPSSHISNDKAKSTIFYKPMTEHVSILLNDFSFPQFHAPFHNFR
jgi:hypothetical protein